MPVRFTIAFAAVTGTAWAATVGTAPTLVKAKPEHKFDNVHPDFETEEGFQKRLARQGTSKIKRMATEAGVVTDASSGKVLQGGP